MDNLFSFFVFLVFLALYYSNGKFPCHGTIRCTLGEIYFLLNFVHILPSCGLDHFHSLQQGVLGAGMFQDDLQHFSFLIRTNQVTAA